MTDEGAYVAWPLRVFLGERPFAAELLTLIRPIEEYLAFIYTLHPAISLFEFRMLGWTQHVLAFSVLSIFVFRLSHAPVRSLLLAGVPLFVCHIFGLAIPSYNTVSSDFLLLALSLWGLSILESGKRVPLGLAGGAAWFIATLAHPGLGLVAAVALLREGILALRGRKDRNGVSAGIRAGLAVFVSGWVFFGLYFIASGTFSRWLERLSLSRAPVTAGASVADRLFELLRFPFSYDLNAIFLTIVLTGVAIFAAYCARTSNQSHARLCRLTVALLLLLGVELAFVRDIGFLPVGLTMAALFSSGFLYVLPNPSDEPRHTEIRFLVSLSCLAALTYAVLTYYFNPVRSWTSGVLGLPFAFATGFSLVLGRPPERREPALLLITGVLGLVLVSSVRDHQRDIYRDDNPAGLTAKFEIPRLRDIRSTPERVRSLNELHRHLGPQLAPGETLLAFDDCPMLYFIFNTRPAYGLAWAVRYGQQPATLDRLNRELLSRPLPRFAIRTLVDVSYVDWSNARPTRYDNYPLNETLLRYYELDRTIHPFEVWRLKSATGGLMPQAVRE